MPVRNSKPALQAQPSEPAWARDLRKLTLLLTEESGFRLLLATYRDSALRDEIIARLRDELLAHEVQVVSVDMAEVPRGTPILGSLRESLAGARSRFAFRPALVVVGLEPHLDYGGVSSLADRPDLTLFETANLQRDAFPLACPAPVLFWLSPLATAAFAKAAPDLWHWRDATFDFSGPPASPYHVDAWLPVLRSFPAEELAEPADLARLRELETRATQLRANARGEMKGPQAQLALVLLEWGDALWPTQPQSAQSLYQEACSLADHLGDARLQFDALGRLGRLALFRKEFDEARRRFGAQRAVAQSFNEPRPLAEVLGNLAEADWQAAEFEPAAQWLRQQTALLRQTSDTSQLARAFARLAMATLQTGQLAEAAHWGHESLERAHASGDQRAETVAVGVLGLASGVGGEPRRALGYFSQMREAARRGHDPRQESVALANSAIACQLLGERDRAVAFAQQALALAEPTGELRTIQPLKAILSRSQLRLDAPRWWTELTLEQLRARVASLQEQLADALSASGGGSLKP